MTTIDLVMIMFLAVGVIAPAVFLVREYRKRREP